jgi:hypothetical protein
MFVFSFLLNWSTKILIFVGLEKFMPKNYVFQTIFCTFAGANRKKQLFTHYIYMDLTGRIIAVLPAQSGVSARTGNTWMSQDYVIEVPGTYPKRCVFRIFGEDRIKQYNVQMNEDVTVQFDIDAHEYQGRWFNDIRAFNIIRGQVPVAAPEAGATPFPPQQMAAAPGQAAPAATPFPPAQEAAAEGSADDLPF